MVAVALGVGALAESSVVWFALTKLAGGMYLAYLGIRTFRTRGDRAAAIER